MVPRVSLLAVLVVLLVLLTPLAGYAQDDGPCPFLAVPPTIYNARIGVTILAGQLEPACANLTVYLYQGAGLSGPILGSSTVNPNGTFRVNLSRPLRGGEFVTLYAECGSRDPIQCWVIQVRGEPPTIPEPTTLLLLGSGLAALAGVTRKQRLA